MYVTSTFIVEPGTPYNQIVVFDGTTPASGLGLIQQAGAYDSRGIFAPAPRPAAPGPLVSSVQGRAVSLQWSPVAGPATTTRYVLEVGSAPGLNDIFSGLDVGLETSFAASGVPPGAYYVRVRAGNYSGLSAPSNEVAVVVS